MKNLNHRVHGMHRVGAPAPLMGFARKKLLPTHLDRYGALASAGASGRLKPALHCTAQVTLRSTLQRSAGSGARMAGVNCGDSSSSNGKTWRSIVIECNGRTGAGRSSWKGMFRRMTVATDVATERETEEIMKRLRQDLRLRLDPDGAT